MRKIYLAFLLCPALLLAQASSDPVAVFSSLNGTWQGTFVGYDVEGQELYRLQARHVYRTVDAHTQLVTLTDTLANGETITGEGENTAHREEDGSLTLRCVVRKSNGETVEHHGRLVQGPELDQQIMWFSSGSGRQETFREWVKEADDGPIYHIHGMGRYGHQLVLMVGRYKKQ